MAVNDRRDLKIECVPLDTLKPDPGNPKQHSVRQIRQIARSIEVLGFNDPILIDRDGRILGGHGRALALQFLGRTVVPVIRIEHLTPAQASAYAITENRLAELAVWDDELLGERFQE